MTTLFIIGNGFDLAHGLPTSYDHFKEYLRTEYEYEYDEMPQIWEQSTMMHDGSEEYDVKKCAHIIDYLVSNVGESMTSEYEWKDFERALGKLNLREIEEEIYHQYDNEGDMNPFRTGYLYEDAYHDLEHIMMFVQKLFKEWINTIKIPEQYYSLHRMDVYENLRELFESVDNPVFLTFNYTDTLEILYTEEEVTHIHGDVNNPIVGHGDKTVVEELVFNQDEYIDRISARLGKPCESIIESNSIFFRSLEHITDIYSYGFSFSDVDAIYIKEIINNIENIDVTWHLQEYSKDRHDEYTAKLKRYGFEGEFDTF